MKSNHPSAGLKPQTRQRQPHSPHRPQKSELRGLLERLSFALGPLGAGFILDALDLATFGPIGLCLGALVGGYAGWILSKHEGIDRALRIAYAICAAAYMTIPFTEAIPAATTLMLLARFFVGPRAEVTPVIGSNHESEVGNTKRTAFSRNQAWEVRNPSPS